MLQDFCKSRGVSLYKCAKDTGIPYSTLFEFATGKHSPETAGISMYKKIADYFYMPVDILYQICRGDSMMPEIKTDDIVLKAEMYSELINDMQAKIYEYSQTVNGNLKKEIQVLNEQLSEARMEVRIYTDEAHFKKWNDLLLSVRSAILRDSFWG